MDCAAVKAELMPVVVCATVCAVAGVVATGAVKAPTTTADRTAFLSILFIPNLAPSGDVVTGALVTSLAAIRAPLAPLVLADSFTIVALLLLISSVIPAGVMNFITASCVPSNAAAGM